MKKLLVAVVLLVASSFVFANERILENFWNKGQVIKIIENDVIAYINKSSISIIYTVKGDGWLEILSVSTDHSYDRSYSSTKYDISSDNAGNIVITEK